MRHFLLPLLLVPLLAACAHRPLPDTCYLQPVSGKCRASILRYWYDERAGTCKGFVWGGCEGVVPFDTLDACHAQCMPGKPMPEAPVLKGATAAPAPASP